MTYKTNQKLYWFPPKNYGQFFLRSSDEEFKRKHPVGYWFAVALGITALVTPMGIYGIVMSSPTMGLAGLAGTFIIGIGLFNFVAIIFNQYLGHFISILSFLLGAILIAIDIGIL